MKLFKLIDVTFYYNDEENIPENERTYLCAIGEYDENDKECQEWDDSIFFWFNDEAEIKKYFMENKGYHGNHEDFTVLSYEYREVGV